MRKSSNTISERQEPSEASKQTIAILPGDGIGPEVIAEARRVLD